MDGRNADHQGGSHWWGMRKVAQQRPTVLVRPAEWCLELRAKPGPYTHASLDQFQPCVHTHVHTYTHTSTDELGSSLPRSGIRGCNPHAPGPLKVSPGLPGTHSLGGPRLLFIHNWPGGRGVEGGTLKPRPCPHSHFHFNEMKPPPPPAPTPKPS